MLLGTYKRDDGMFIPTHVGLVLSTLLHVTGGNALLDEAGSRK